MSLAVLVPSRGRPKNLERLIEAFEATRTSARLVIGLDEDDPTLEDYMSLSHSWSWLSWAVEPNLRGVVAWINHLASLNVETHEYIGTIGDDNVPRTEEWDKQVIASLEHQGVGMCFGDDGYELRQRGTLCTHVFLTSSIITALGYFGPPQLRHMYVDPCWMQWGLATSIEYLPDVLIEHLHYSAGKAEHDETYRAADAQMGPDGVAYNHYCQGGMQADIAKIKALKERHDRSNAVRTSG